MATQIPLPEERFLQAVFEDVPDDRLAAPFEAGEEAVLGNLRKHIDEALAILSYRERGILEMRFGLRDGYSYTLAEAGYVFKLTRERIRQLQVKAMRKLAKRALRLREFLNRPTAAERSAAKRAKKAR